MPIPKGYRKPKKSTLGWVTEQPTAPDYTKRKYLNRYIPGSSVQQTHQWEKTLWGMWEAQLAKKT